MAFLTVLLICATMDIVISNRHVQMDYIINHSLPGGPLGLPATLRAITILRIDGVVNLVEDFLILGVLLWRVWVVWTGTRFVIPITVVSLFLYLPAIGLATAYRAIMWEIETSSLAATPRAESIIFVLASVFSISSLVFMTSSIITRLALVRREHIKLMGRSDIAGQYLGIATMLIESYALDTLWNIGTIISYSLRYAPTVNLFITCTIQVDILANYLVVYRVLSGRAWDRQTQHRLSTLKWDQGPGVATIGTLNLRQSSTSEEESSMEQYFRGDVYTAPAS
ncbi:hypothetical protein AGABI1DRAFT_127448 [Agaricus bisporus var. burnettii JB137-S8]|uniref:Uncharacterized protein n=1 Tax=Agaricus bisporus var. burnettii (strain JB137-S8 / ATCC MYA-4627 / FGSC 10392) TaxID=597362 RepID=K5VZ24_AGABU|nr:uncharacterized protein AGABI1DRAFT_127448 [Agaricus bisporus var. burnettii JB137-S8]EKM79764.1 hypothetical protein AGABI1DRAFT_127448 [Agaricus bisporus var. burnettii JB137-S8]